jgi:hypothetical protein
MQAIVLQQNIDDTIALIMAEAIEVHRGEVHAHQRMDAM